MEKELKKKNMDAFEPTDDEIDDDFPSQDHRRNIHQFYSNTSNSQRERGRSAGREEEAAKCCKINKNKCEWKQIIMSFILVNKILIEPISILFASIHQGNVLIRLANMPYSLILV